jgi:3-oxoacyl-[acyl-carrier-protein] synthase-1
MDKTSKRNPIPIIGMGAVSCAGVGVAACKEAVFQGRDCLVPLSIFETGLKTPPLSGQIAHVPREYAGPHKTAALALCAVSEAMSGITDRKGLSMGFVTATTVGGMTRSELFYKAYKADATRIADAGEELFCHEPTALSGFLCKKFRGNGFHTLSTACSTGLHAIGMAKRLVENNVYDLCCAVGSDALSVLTIRGFSGLMLLDPTGCKPFDKRRAGTSLGEGAGAMLVASEKAADSLGAEPLAFISGWGASADCHHMTAPHPQGAGAQTAVRAALDEAGITPQDIELIASHGTATPDNDVSEIIAMKEVFGAVPPFCSMKRTLGHTLAASGILEAVFAVCAMRDGRVPHTGGFAQTDEAIGIAPAASKGCAIRHVLKNSFGFGGNNAAVVFSMQGRLR